METDENAPPPNDAKPTPAGLLSPFGFLAGVRAMLSPSVKEELSQAPESPGNAGRPVLRDMNASGSPRQKVFTSLAQGGQPGQTPGDPASASAFLTSGDLLLSPGDRSSWTEKGEGTSVASEISFVSAVSTGNTSLPDLLQPTSPTRLNGIESDTDTSTAYESAGETEGNFSAFEDAFRNSSNKIDLNYRIAVSSPFDQSLQSEAVGQNSERTIGLNETIQLEDSAENGRDSLSVSHLVDHLGSLSLSTPLKAKRDASPAKAHITLDSDVSGDIISSPGPDHDSEGTPETEVKESLETTISLSHENEDDSINESVILEEPQSSEEVLSHHGGQYVNLNQTVELCSGSRAGDFSILSLPEESASEIAASEIKAIEELGDSFNYSSLNQSDLSAIEAKLLEGFEKSFPYEVIHGGNQEALNETVLEVAKDPPSLESNELPSSNSCVTAESVTGSNTTVEAPFVDALDKSINEKEVISSNSVIENQENVETSPLLDTEEQRQEIVICATDSNQETTVSQELIKLTDSQNDNALSEALETQTSGDSENNGIVSEVEPHEDSKTVVIENANSFEDAPLPVKVPRSFEEILAEQLAAEEQTADVAPAKPEEISIPASSSFDEAPLPVKTLRTFEEILAEELAAHNFTPVQSELESCKPSQSCEEAEGSASDESCALLEHEATLVEEESSASEALEDYQSTELPTEITEVIHPETFCSEAESDEVPIPIKPPRTSEEILEAQLAAQGDPELAVPSFSTSEEIPIRIKPPRTFEEILSAELNAQSDPEQAVPSFSLPVSPGKLDESYAKIISSESSSIESECASVLISDNAAGEPELESNGGLDSLIEKCKLQEQDLEFEDRDFKCVETEAGRLSLSCLNESQRTYSTVSEDSASSDLINQTVIMVDCETSNNFMCNEDSSSENTEVQVASADPQFDEQFLGTVNLAEEEFESGDAFKDPSAFDYLSLHGGSRSIRDLRKESLYVKFDPLVGTLVSDTFGSMHPENSSDSQTGATAVAAEGQQVLEAQVSSSEQLVSLSPSSSKQTHNNLSSAATTTPLKTNSIQSTPAKTPAHVMLNETLESIGSRGTIVKQEDLIKKLQEHQSVLEEQDKAYQERISGLEQRLQEMDLQKGDSLLQGQVQEKERQLQERERQLQEKEKQLQEKTQSLGELNVIMKEYEKTISRLVAEKSQEKAAFDEKQVDLIKDRDQAQQHLNTMEIAFADIHTKYERIKNVVELFKKNEETLNAALNEKEANFEKMQSMYDMLKSHAVSKLEKANQDLEAIKQKHQQETAKMKAMIKKLEIKTKSLEDTLEQKVKENQALTAICDELINKVGE